MRIKLGAAVLLALIAWALAANILPSLMPGLPIGDYWVAGLAGAVLFDIGVLIHEFAHAVIARRAGMQVEVVVLELVGGGTEVRGQPPSARAEAQTALAGPAASVAFAGILAAVSSLLLAYSGPALAVVVSAYVAAASLVVGLINILPGAPLDGGRALHAWLWHRHGDRHRADIGALRGGWIIDFSLLGLGVIMSLVGWPEGWWLTGGGVAMLIATRGESRTVKPPRPPAPEAGTAGGDRAPTIMTNEGTATVITSADGCSEECSRCPTEARVRCGFCWLRTIIGWPRRSEPACARTDSPWTSPPTEKRACTERG
ncbi:MAG: site-2 protease family protein [Sciscionella sp.]